MPRPRKDSGGFIGLIRSMMRGAGVVLREVAGEVATGVLAAIVVCEVAGVPAVPCDVQGSGTFPRATPLRYRALCSPAGNQTFSL